MSATVRTQHEEPRRPDEPVASLDRPRISVRRTDGVAVVRPVGALDRPVVDKLRRAALDADRPVVVDLDDCVIVDAEALDRIALDPQLSGLSEVCFVTRSTPVRDLLGRSDLAHRYPVFKRVEDALQARVFAREGYGGGWTA